MPQLIITLILLIKPDHDLTGKMQLLTNTDAEILQQYINKIIYCD